ncbi:MAG: MerR family transcriptional regulator [Candidatus Binatia bacterium]
MDGRIRGTVVEPHEAVYTIGIAASRIGVSPETLRLYERKGLIIPYRTETARRLYSEKDLEWIACIRRQIREQKLNLAGIRRLLALIPCWEIKPCTVTKREQCPASRTTDRPCWNVEETEDRKSKDECRTCKVYLSAVKIENCKKLSEMSVTPSP